MKILFTFIAALAFFSVGYAHEINPIDMQTLITDPRWQDFVRVGAEHMLTGMDHILFLIALTFLINNIKDILTYITLFTIGHSLSLVIATRYGITMDGHLVDAFIALTVCYKAFENINNVKNLNIKFLPIAPMVAFFGLVHGFGLSTKLQDATSNTEVAISNILSFNVGVEFGQIAVLFIVLLFKQIYTSKFNKYALPSNYILFGLGVYLFIEQLLQYFI